MFKPLITKSVIEHDPESVLATCCAAHLHKVFLCVFSHLLLGRGSGGAFLAKILFAFIASTILASLYMLRPLLSEITYEQPSFECDETRFLTADYRVCVNEQAVRAAL